MLKALVRRVAPESAYGIGRRIARHMRRRVRLPPLTEAALASVVRDELGVCKGDVVLVHSSVDALQLGFSFARLLPLLRDLVGSEGTLLFPASHLLERPERWFERNDVFDVLRTPTSMGILPELARRQTDAVRSLHPTHSVVAIGSMANELVSTHHRDRYPCGRESPFFKITQCGGKIIGLGVETDVLTSVHCVEDLSPDRFPVCTHREQVYEGRVRTREGTECVVQTLVAHPRIRWRRMRPFFERYVEQSYCRLSRCADRPFYRADAAGLLRHMSELSERGITMYRRGIYRGHIMEPMLSELAERLEER